VKKLQSLRAALGAVVIAGVGVVGVFKLALWVADSAGRCGASGRFECALFISTSGF